MRKNLFITWVTHNSRYNERMKLLKIEKSEGYFLDDDDRILIYNLIFEKLRFEGIKSFTLNVLSDHIHLVLMYEDLELSNLIQQIKGYVAFKYLRFKGFSSEGSGRENKLWAKGFSKTYLDTDEHYEKAIKYTLENHEKHGIKSILQFVNRGL